MKINNYLKLILVTLTSYFGLLMLSPVVLAQTNFDPLSQSCSEFQLDNQGNPLLDSKKNKIKNDAVNGPICQQKTDQLTKKTNPVVDTIHTATNILGIVAGVGAVIIIIYSGFVFVTAGGALSGSRSGDNPNRARQARSSLTGAVIGLIIVALSWAIITFFTNRLL